MKPWITVCIATYNPGDLIFNLIRNIRQQHSPGSDSEVEILIIDGGSTNFAKNDVEVLGCRFISNPHGDAINAKFIGFFEAKSDFVCFLDQDELLVNEMSLINKIHLFETNPDLAIAFTSGYSFEKNTPSSNIYGSQYGDPVNYFVFRTSSLCSQRLNDFKKKLNIKVTNDNFTLFKCDELRTPILAEAVACGTIVNKSLFLTSTLTKIDSAVIIPHLFYLLFESSSDFLVAVINNDPVLHVSSENWMKIIKKVRWRVANAIQTEKIELQKSGIAGRIEIKNNSLESNKIQNKMKFRIFLFPLYVIFQIALIDSIHLAFRNRRFGYLMHAILSNYVLIRAFLELLDKYSLFNTTRLRYDGSN